MGWKIDDKSIHGYTITYPEDVQVGSSGTSVDADFMVQPMQRLIDLNQYIDGLLGVSKLDFKILEKWK